MAGKNRINNDFYCDLQNDWHEGCNHPIALLRAENAVRNPWIAEIIGKNLGKNISVLDIGCGAGFLTGFLASEGHSVCGVDLSSNSLEMARLKDPFSHIDYRHGSAYELPYPDATFDAVCAMDLLEHVESPKKVIEQASRVLKPGGLFFFHTFNRNFLSYLFIIKGVEWCLKNTPPNMHVYPLFIKPSELAKMCQDTSLDPITFKGFTPKMTSRAFWRMVFTGRVDDTFPFIFTNSLSTGYCGFARKAYNRFAVYEKV